MNSHYQTRDDLMLKLHEVKINIENNQKLLSHCRTGNSIRVNGQTWTHQSLIDTINIFIKEKVKLENKIKTLDSSSPIPPPLPTIVQTNRKRPLTYSLFSSDSVFVPVIQYNSDQNDNSWSCSKQFRKPDFWPSEYGGTK